MNNLTAQHPGNLMVFQLAQCFRCATRLTSSCSCPLDGCGCPKDWCPGCQRRVMDAAVVYSCVVCGAMKQAQSGASVPVCRCGQRAQAPIQAPPPPAPPNPWVGKVGYSTTPQPTTPTPSNPNGTKYAHKCGGSVVMLVMGEKCLQCEWLAGEDEMRKELKQGSQKGRCLAESPRTRFQEEAMTRVVTCSLRPDHEGPHIAYDKHNEYMGKLLEWEE